ncbi:MAG: mechanosensitive ion channel [Bacteroidales bacterium]|jgi:small-conductance mechanosensitive channel|nr:mechanosensitive ion channel [Bacteroidales bacterium]MDD4385484.1 mechanosensitive ion channel [Bacteroidales bacterium]
MNLFHGVEYIERIFISALVILAGVLTIFFTIRWLRKYLKVLKEKLIRRRIIRRAIIPSLLLVLLISLRLNLPILFSDEDLLANAAQFTTILLIIAGAWVAINAMAITRIIILSNYDLKQKNNLLARKMHTQLRIIERVILFTIIFFAVASILMTFESIRRIGISLFASAGVAGLILGLAAQKVIGSMLAGIQLAITQPIRIDDVVIVENEWGWIEEITLTYVVVRLWDKRRLVVPSTYFIEKPFQNWTRTSAQIMGTVFIYTDYTMPIEPLRNVFEEILKQSGIWDGQVANVQVTNSTNHSLELRFLMSAIDSPTLWDLRVFAREKLVEFMQQNYPEKLPRARVMIDKDEMDKNIR